MEGGVRRGGRRRRPAAGAGGREGGASAGGEARSTQAGHQLPRRGAGSQPGRVGAAQESRRARAARGGAPARSHGDAQPCATDSSRTLHRELAEARRAPRQRCGGGGGVRQSARREQAPPTPPAPTFAQQTLVPESAGARLSCCRGLSRASSSPHPPRSSNSAGSTACARSSPAAFQYLRGRGLCTTCCMINIVHQRRRGEAAAQARRAKGRRRAADSCASEHHGFRPARTLRPIWDAGEARAGGDGACCAQGWPRALLQAPLSTPRLTPASIPPVEGTFPTYFCEGFQVPVSD